MTQTIANRTVVNAPIEAVIAHLESFPGAKIVRVTTLTLPKMNVKSRVTKEPNPHTEGVTRRASRIIVLGANYEAAVNRQRANEATDEELPDLEYFAAEKLWHGAGERIEGHPMLARYSTTGQVYFCYRPHQDRETGLPDCLADEWRSVKTGAVIDVDTLIDLLPVPSSAPKQEVDRPVPWRTLHVENMREVVHGEYHFILPPGPIIGEGGKMVQVTM